MFALLMLLILTGLIIYAGYIKSQLNTSVFPARDTEFLWDAAVEPKKPITETRLAVKNEVGTIEYEFYLSSQEAFPYTHYSMYFVNAIQSFVKVDLTRYSNIAFKIQCDPKNVLLLVLFSFDEKVTVLNDMTTRRVSSIAFSCDKHWSDVSIDFDDLDTPHWWLDRYGFEFSDTSYQLDKTMGFAWVNSLQSPLNTPSHVRLTDIKLQGKDFRYLYGAGALALAIWILFFIWQIRRYLVVLTIELKDKVRKDQPLLAYKKLSIEPQKDKEKGSLLRYVATEYANPELSLEMAAATLGINRTKINDILKDELGLTFSTYLNKLRLTEAARLLSENNEANISEIAYSVGYNNVSYFSKLFKQEYDCAPKTFKSLYLAKEDIKEETY
ncbi:MAG: helix-turn-helix transcriptional regulator [Pseudomonadota bacterium]